MKKLLCIFLALLATICLLSMTVSAKSTIVLSEDLKTLTVGDQTYSQADLSAIDLYYSQGPTNIQIPANMESQIRNIVAYSTYNDWIISVELYYFNGSKMDICFVENSVLPELMEICQGDDAVFGIEFWWESTPSVTATIAQFKDTPATLAQGDIWGDYYEVVYAHKQLDAYVYRGFICEYRDEYYYVDYQENYIYDPVHFYPTEGPDLYKAYKITDPELHDQIYKAIESEVSGTTDIGQALSSFFLSFVFAFIPIVIFVPSLIFAIRGKGYYRITWGVTAGLCVAELIVFFVTFILLRQ